MSISTQRMHHAEFRSAIVEIGRQFDSELLTGEKGALSLKRLYRTHDRLDMASLRDLEKHYWWMPNEVTPNFGAIDLEKAKVKATLSDDLPFGTVVTSNEQDNLRECYVHITQPCDLGKPDTVSKQKSLLFVRAELIRAPILSTPKSTTIDAPGPTYDGVDYEMIIRKDQLLALPAPIVLKRCKNQRLWPLGRLRSHVTRQVLNAVSDWSTRLDAILATKHVTVAARIAVKYATADGTATEWFPGDVHMTSFDERAKLWYVLDEAQWRFPLWCEQLINSANVTATGLAGLLVAGVEKVGTGGKANGNLVLHVKNATAAATEGTVTAVTVANGKTVVVFVLQDAETQAPVQPGPQPA